MSLPCGHELYEEAREVDVGHEPATELGAEDQRCQVFLRRLQAAARRELERVHRHLHVAVAGVGGVAPVADSVAVPVVGEVGVLAARVHLGPAVDLRPVVPW